MQTGKPGRPTKRVKRIAADKGYDSKVLRESLRRKGIQPQIAKRRNAKVKSGRPVEKSALGFKWKEPLLTYRESFDA